MSPAFTELARQARFAASLGRLRELCAGLDAGGGPLSTSPGPLRLIDELVRSLGEHVAETEKYLHAVARSRHDLLPAIVDLRADHAALTRALVDLRLVALDTATWCELPLRVRRFSAKVNSHSDAETLLLERAAESTTLGT